MTEPDIRDLRIHDAFEYDLAEYRAPADLPQRARLGGIRRERRVRRRLVTYGVTATALAAASAVVTAVALAPQPGTSPQAVGRSNAPSTPGPTSSAGLPSSQSVGKAMLTAVDGVSDDILYSTEMLGGTTPAQYQGWEWPAQPTAGQQVQMREIYSQQTSRGQMQAIEDFEFSEINSGVDPSSPPQKVPGQVTMVCYAGGDGCGFGNVNTQAGTWSQFPLPAESVETPTLGEGSPFSPDAIAQGIANGEYQVEGRTQLDGRQALVLRQTTDEMQPQPFVLWVDAQTNLPLQWTAGGAKSAWGMFTYLPPTQANQALFKVPVPKGYPKSSPETKPTPNG